MGIHSPAIHINQFEPQLGDLRSAVDGYAVERLVMNVVDHTIDWSVPNNNSPHNIRLTINPEAFTRASSQGGADEELLVWLDVRCARCHRIGDVSATYDSSNEPTWSVRGLHVVC